jgi:hypothetical protein
MRLRSHLAVTTMADSIGIREQIVVCQITDHRLLLRDRHLVRLRALVITRDRRIL